MPFSASPIVGGILKGHLFSFRKPGPVALTSATEPLAPALGGEVGPPALFINVSFICQKTHNNKSMNLQKNTDRIKKVNLNVRHFYF